MHTQTSKKFILSFIQVTYLGGMVKSLQTSLKKRFRGIFVNVKMDTSERHEDLPFADPLYLRAAVLDPAFALMWLDHDVLVSDLVKRELSDTIKGQ